MTKQATLLSTLSLGKKIIGIGWNYAKHAKELGNSVPATPMFFLKPTSSIVFQNQKQGRGVVEIPKGCIVHHELELGVIIGKRGRDIPQSRAMSHVAGYVLGLDMTARNIQSEAKKKGQPWTVAKGYDTFTPLGDVIEEDAIGDPHALDLVLKVNDEVRQHGSTSDMIFQIPRLIEHVSSIMTLEEGDLILTGTPEGVGPVVPGDTLVGTVSKNGKLVSKIEFPVVSRPLHSSS